MLPGRTGYESTDNRQIIYIDILEQYASKSTGSSNNINRNNNSGKILEKNKQIYACIPARNLFSGVSSTTQAINIRRAVIINVELGRMWG
jgi:hypothetical protein